MRPISCLFALLFLPGCPVANDAEEEIDPRKEGSVWVNVDTTMGAMVFEIDLLAAPISGENFLSYVDEGFFDGRDGLDAVGFHRVVSGFVVQGGGYTEAGAAKETHGPIVLESENGLLNVRGSLAMARLPEADTATSQFYVNLVDNVDLDYKNERNPGYAVFGSVVDGMDVVDAIAAVEVNPDTSVPLKPVMITACERD